MPADTVTRIDARLTALATMLTDAKTKNCGTVETMLRRRLDTVLDSRLTASRETAMRELAAVIKGDLPADAIARTR